MSSASLRRSYHQIRGATLSRGAEPRTEREAGRQSDASFSRPRPVVDRTRCFTKSDYLNTPTPLRETTHNPLSCEEERTRTPATFTPRVAHLVARRVSRERPARGARLEPARAPHVRDPALGAERVREATHRRVARPEVIGARDGVPGQQIHVAPPADPRPKRLCQRRARAALLPRPPAACTRTSRAFLLWRPCTAGSPRAAPRSGTRRRTARASPRAWSGAQNKNAEGRLGSRRMPGEFGQRVGDAHRADREAPPADPEVLVERPVREEHLLEIHQWLAHAHHDHVRAPAPEDVLQRQHLVHDLGGVEVPLLLPVGENETVIAQPTWGDDTHTVNRARPRRRGRREQFGGSEPSSSRVWTDRLFPTSLPPLRSSTPDAPTRRRLRRPPDRFAVIARRRRLVGLELVAVLVKRHTLHLTRRIARLRRFLRMPTASIMLPQWSSRATFLVPSGDDTTSTGALRPTSKPADTSCSRTTRELLDVVHGGLAHAVNRVVDLLASVRGLAHVPRQARQRLFAHPKESVGGAGWSEDADRANHSAAEAALTNPSVPPSPRVTTAALAALERHTLGATHGARGGVRPRHSWCVNAFGELIVPACVEVHERENSAASKRVCGSCFTFSLHSTARRCARGRGLSRTKETSRAHDPVVQALAPKLLLSGVS